MTKIAIHQPNYLPWFGFFAKISVADIFVFLDDVAFSKGSYINRVQFLHGAQPRWLTVPVLHKKGSLINETLPSSETWRYDHINSLTNWYRKSPRFSEVMEEFGEMLFSASAKNNLAELNKLLIIKLADRLGIHCRFVSSSELSITAMGTERLIEIVKKIDAKGQYLSGQGGVKYQDPHKFSEARIDLKYLDFKHPVYSQSTEDFIPGLSIMDAVFRLGWDRTARLLKNAQKLGDE